MHLPLFDVNFVAVFVAAAAAYLFGGAWYFFGEKEGKAGKPTPAHDKAQESTWSYLGSIATTIVIAWTMAVLARAVGAAGVLDGAMLAFHCWLGFMATVAVERVLWGEGRRKEVVFHATYQLLSLLVIGMIVGVWH
jgi:hypothetical protein